MVSSRNEKTETNWPAFLELYMSGLFPSNHYKHLFQSRREMLQ
jgi:hypothetical protein